MGKVEKDIITQEDLNFYSTSVYCEMDGPFPEYDSDGNKLPSDTSNIVVAKTLS